jgi:YD repeat-containing protein
VTDLRGHTYTYAYDASGRLWTERDQNDHLIVKNTYGPDGRVVEQEDGNAQITRYAWDEATRTATVTDARDNAWTYVFNDTLLVKKTNPLGNSVRFQYDPDTGDQIAYRDALGRVVAMSYDTRHNMLTRTAPAPLSYQEVWTYNAFNDPLTFKDGRGNQTDYGYDSRGNLTSVTGPDPDGPGPLGRPITTYERDPVTGQIASITDPRQKITRFGYDATTRELISRTTPLNGKTTLTYDATGRLRTSVDPRGNIVGAQPSDYTTTYSYDDADHLTQLSSPDPDGTGPHTPSITRWSFDPAGNPESFTDPNSHTTIYGYDVANRLATVTAPDPDDAGPLTRPVTSYTYDEVGSTKTRTVAGDHTTTFAYDEANRLSSVTSPTGQLWTYTYDANGNRATQVDANGNSTPAAGDGQTTYTYDVLGRLTSILYSDATPAVGFSYDGNGNLIHMTDGSGTETHNYDTLNRLTSVTRGTAAFSYTYDAAGNRTQTTYPDGTVVAAGYDDDARLASITSGGVTTSYGYDATGNRTTTTLPSANGHVETRSYDRVGRLTGVANKKGTTTLSAFALTLDPAGNPLTSVRSGGTSETTAFTYDNLDRLTGVCFKSSCPLSNDPYIRWTYDLRRRRESSHRNPPVRNQGLHVQRG